MIVLRKIAVAMHFEAYNGLGFFYKLQNGYYSGAARQAWAHMPNHVKYTGVAVLGVAITTAVYLKKR